MCVAVYGLTGVAVFNTAAPRNNAMRFLPLSFAVVTWFITFLICLKSPVTKVIMSFEDANIIS